MAHPWFASFDWQGLINKTSNPLYIPSPDIQKNFDHKNVNEQDFDDERLLVDFIKELRTLSGQEPFNNYYFNIEEESKE